MELEDYIKRELDNVYVSTLIIKETVYKRENKIPIKQDVYIIMGLNLSGYKKIIDVVVPIEDTTSYWYNVISSYKSRGIEKFFMVALTDNMHIIRNLTKCVSKKEWKELCNDLKEIYKAPTKEAA